MLSQTQQHNLHQLSKYPEFQTLKEVANELLLKAQSIEDIDFNRDVDAQAFGKHFAANYLKEFMQLMYVFEQDKKKDETYE